jgi:hypothetical protein
MESDIEVVSNQTLNATDIQVKHNQTSNVSEFGVYLKQTLDAMDRLLNLFRFERAIHLIVGVVSFALLLYVIYSLLSQNNLDKTLLIPLFGSAGLITVSSARITYFFNKAFNLIEIIVQALLIERKTIEEKK